MSRLTGNEAKGLMEAYNAVYAPQQEEVVEEVGQIDEASLPAGNFQQTRSTGRGTTETRNLYRSSSDNKVYANYNDALAARNSRLQTLSKAQSDIKRAAPGIILPGDPRLSRPAGAPVDGSASPSRFTAPPRDVVVQAAKGGVPGTLNKTTGKWTANANSTATAGSTPTTKTTPAPTSTTPTPAARPSLRSDIEDLRRMQAASMMRQQGRNMPDGSIPTGDSLKPKPAPVPAATAPAPKPAPVPAATEKNKKNVDGDGTPMGQKREVPLWNSVDLFDIVKGHLMSEGYATTEEAAIAIMANMSEEWKQSILEAPGEWFGGIRDKARSSRAAQMQSLQQPPKPLPSVASPFAKPASRTDSGRLTTYGAGGGAEAERRGQTRAQVMQQGAKNLENKKKTQPVNQGPDFGR